ncbi:MAG: ATP-dependent Clp protease ATP-binding subunit ClpX, partial [Pseudomonadota bacterium]
FIQVDTSHILFIVGGAFDGIEKIVRQRTGKKSLGFGTTEMDVAEVTSPMQAIENEDLLKFGMIPEFIGRLPIVAALDELDETALIEILTKPKNALVRQYTHLVEMEGVDLKFTDESLVAIAQKALERKTGARGLRSIIEKAMLNIMFEIPSTNSIKEIIITPEVIREAQEPVVVHHNKALAS